MIQIEYKKYCHQGNQYLKETKSAFPHNTLNLQVRQSKTCPQLCKKTAGYVLLYLNLHEFVLCYPNYSLNLSFILNYCVEQTFSILTDDIFLRLS